MGDPFWAEAERRGGSVPKMRRTYWKCRKKAPSATEDAIQLALEKNPTNAGAVVKELMTSSDARTIVTMDTVPMKNIYYGVLNDIPTASHQAIITAIESKHPELPSVQEVLDVLEPGTLTSSSRVDQNVDKLCRKDEQALTGITVSTMTGDTFVVKVRVHTWAAVHLHYIPPQHSPSPHTDVSPSHTHCARTLPDWC